MMNSDLQPPHDGPNADPVLYGVACGLAQLFPPVEAPNSGSARDRRHPEGDTEEPGERREG